MSKSIPLAVLAVALLVPAAHAQGFRFGFGFGRGSGFRYGRPGFPGYWPPYPGYPGYGFRRPFRAQTLYQNAFTGDVAFAERTVNGFRAAYEKRGDPVGAKADIQRMDEAMERLRAEAERYGSATIRGEALLRTALGRAEAVDRRFRGTDDPLGERWHEALTTLRRLARSYRARDEGDRIR